MPSRVPSSSESSKDGDDVVVLSPTIPNDIHLWLVQPEGLTCGVESGSSLKEGGEWFWPQGVFK